MHEVKIKQSRYLELAAADPRIKTIDATRSLNEVMSDIRQTVTAWVQEQGA